LGHTSYLAALHALQLPLGCAPLVRASSPSLSLPGKHTCVSSERRSHFVCEGGAMLAEWMEWAATLQLRRFEEDTSVTSRRPRATATISITGRWAAQKVSPSVSGTSMDMRRPHNRFTGVAWRNDGLRRASKVPRHAPLGAGRTRSRGGIAGSTLGRPRFAGRKGSR
jgi:hypothetical protein